MQDEGHPSTPDRLKAPTEHYWDRLLHEDDLFSGRINFFLIAESMLLIAFAINAYENSDLTWVLGAAGILFASIWCYVSLIQIYFCINPLKDRLRSKLPEYREMKQIWLIGEPNLWLGILCPLVVIGIWIFFLIQE